MNRVVTTNATITAKQPLVASSGNGSIPFIEDGIQEAIWNMLVGIMGGYTTNDVIILDGFDITISGGGDTATWTAGAVGYNGEIYTVDSGTLNKTGGQTFLYSISVTNDPTNDPILFTDGSTHNVHNVRKITITAGTSGSGIADYGAGTVKLLSILTSGTWTNLTLSNSYTSVVSHTVQYKKDINGIMYLRGQLKAPSSVTSNVFATLPSGFAPVDDSNFVVTANSQVLIGSASRQMQIIDFSGSPVAGNTVHYINAVIFPTI